MKNFIHLIISLSTIIFLVACQTNITDGDSSYDDSIQIKAQSDSPNVDSNQSVQKAMRSSSIDISVIPPTKDGDAVTYAFSLTYPDGTVTHHTSNSKVYAEYTYGEFIYNPDSDSYEENVYSMTVSISRVPPSTLKMNIGEVVTYTFTYPDGKTTRHTLTKEPDGNILGEIIYDFDGTSYNYVIFKNYANIDLYFNETMFLLYGSPLSNTVEKEMHTDELNFDAVAVSPPPSGHVGESCNDSIVNVVAGEFPVEICINNNEYDNKLVTKYTNINYLGDAKPLDGLFKYEQVSNGKVHTVELTYWNGL